jgi:hypothetical protein
VPARVNAAHSVAAAWLSRVAQKKVSVISSWTRDALAAKQTRGFQLGTPANLPDEAKLKGRAARQTNAQTNVRNHQAAQLAALLRANVVNLRACRAAPSLGLYYPAREGFYPMGVQRLLTKTAYAFVRT